MSNQPLEPNATRNIIIAVSVVVMILGSFTTLWLILNPSEPTFTFMKTDQFNVVAVIFGGTPSNATNYINMTIQNIGSSSFTISTSARVNGVNKALAAQVTIQAGYSATVTIPDVNWNDGYQYSMELLTTSGTKITYVANATPGGHSPNPSPSPVDLPPLLKVASILIAIIVIEALWGTVSFSPLIVASQIAIIEIVVLVGVIVLNRKHSQHNVSAPAYPLKSLSLLTTWNVALVVLGILMILGLFIALWLVVSYLYPPLTF